MPNRGAYKTLTEEQLGKLNTKRLLGVRRTLTERMGFIGCHLENIDGVLYAQNGWETSLKEFTDVLVPYDAVLRRVMAKREHVARQ